MKQQCKECRGFLPTSYKDDTCQSCLKQLWHMALLNKALAKRKHELDEEKEAE